MVPKKLCGIYKKLQHINTEGVRYGPFKQKMTVAIDRLQLEHTYLIHKRLSSKLENLVLVS